MAIGQTGFIINIHGNANLVECKIELIGSSVKDYISETFSIFLKVYFDFGKNRRLSAQAKLVPGRGLKVKCLSHFPILSIVNV